MYRFAALFLAFALSAVATANDLKQVKENNWHHWRGPNADGSAPNADPPTKWDEKTNVAWKVELPGKGSATPIVWGNRVFVLTAVKGREAKAGELPKPDPRFDVKTDPPKHFHKFIVLCFDRATGNKLWEKVAAEMVPHEGHQVTHSYAAGSPTTDGKLLYVSFGSFGTYCYDFDGNLKWSRTDLGRLNTRLGWGEAVTPVVYGDSLLLNHDQEADAKLYCLDTANGKTKWVAPRDEKSTWSTPLVTAYNGKTQVVTNGTKRIRSYDLTDGKLIWECAGMTVNPIPSPVRVGDSVVCVSGYKGAAAVSVPLSAKGDLGDRGKVDWRYAAGMPYVPSPALVGDRLYITQTNDTILTVLDAKTGRVVVDKERLPRVKSFYASPMTVAGRVYFVDQAGTALVLKAGDTVDVLAVNKLDDRFDASPVAVGKQLFLRGERHLYCIEAK